MRNALSLLLFAILISCHQDTTQYPNFLLGSWKRVNDSPENHTYEHWEPDFTGIGYTLHSNDTVFKEHLAIIKKNGKLYLSVTGVNESPTLFEFTQQNASSFTCNNPENAFPKIIHYEYKDDFLHASISNEQQTINFKFERLP
jgi:hypothetical protein